MKILMFFAVNFGAVSICLVLISFAGHPGEVLHYREPEKCCYSELGPCHGAGDLGVDLLGGHLSPIL